MIVFVFIQQVYSGAKYPFPQYKSYKFGIKSAIKDSVKIQKAYKTFHDNYYDESGSYARIKWDEPDFTVSEGIGYGMLIMVYMDNALNNTQSKFDKLWAYYKKWANNNGLMHWKIRGFNSIDQQNAATDAELDVALALLMAYKQWGDAKYNTEAKDLIKKIWQHEVNGNKYLKPGDVWDDKKNPSYFCTAALELFKEVDNNDWTTVITNSYKLLKSCRDSSTGLVPDWCSEQGNMIEDKYSYDATRTPWRMAIAYVWFGHSDAKDVAGKMAQWIKTSTSGKPLNVKDGYKLNGTATGQYCIPAYLGPFTNAAMVDATHEQWLTDGYNMLRTFSADDNYYNECLQVLTQLLATGCMPNFYDMQNSGPYKVVVTVSPTEGGTVTLDPSLAEYPDGTEVKVTASPKTGYTFSGWSGDLSGTETTKTFTVKYEMGITANFVKEGTGIDLVDDCEDGDEVNRMGGNWFTYNDSASEGKSTITPKTSVASPFKMADGGYSSQKAAKITFNLDQGDNQYDPFVGVGFTLQKQEKAVDISTATGITFYYKGNECKLRIETENVEDFGYYAFELEASADWQFQSLEWDKFAQPPWADEVPLDLTTTVKISWQIEGETGDNGELSVDKIHLPGYEISDKIIINPIRDHNRALFIYYSGMSPNRVFISYTLYKSSDVILGIYTMKGTLIKEICKERKLAGHHGMSVNMQENGLTSGIYLVRLITNSRMDSAKLMYLK